MFAGSYYEVTDVLMLVACVAPVALYFLTLGLVNSHSRPWLVSSRSDFVSLTIALFPLLVLPIPAFVQSQMWWLLVVAIVLAGLVFRWMLPSSRAGFVIYNISESKCRQLVDRSILQLGWDGQWKDQAWLSDTGQLTVLVRGFSLLRNVTIHIESPRGGHVAEFHALAAEMQKRLQAVSQLPSTTGACLVVLGLGLMILPMWMVSRHINELVDAVTHIFG